MQARARASGGLRSAYLPLSPFPCGDRHRSVLSLALERGLDSTNALIASGGCGKSNARAGARPEKRPKHRPISFRYLLLSRTHATHRDSSALCPSLRVPTSVSKIPRSKNRA